MNPNRVIWVNGNLTLESAGAIGSLPNPADPTVAGPALIVVTGDVIVNDPGVRLYGFVYARGATATLTGTGSGQIQGALALEGNLASTTAFTVALDAAVLNTLRFQHGSFVQSLGNWDDYRPATTTGVEAAGRDKTP
jgi:hypothetical protein